MTIEECIKRFDKLEKLIIKQIPIELQQIVTQDTIAQIENRVVSKQQKATGGSFSSYSRKPILSSGTTAKSKAVGRKLAASKSKRRELDWVTIKRDAKNVHLFVVKGGYAEIRRIEGFNNTKKSFEFTGNMWRGFGIKKVAKKSKEIIITAGGRNEYSQNLIDVHSKKEGISIIDTNKKEEKHIQRQLDLEIEKYVKRVGLK